MSVKGAFKKIWMGVKVAAPYLGMAASFLPGGGALALTLLAIDEFVEQAEVTFAGEGTGPQKSEEVSLKLLKLIELSTGKNADNPETRAIVTEIISVVVETKNETAKLQMLADRYKELVKKLKDAIKHADGPAIDDAP